MGLAARSRFGTPRSVRRRRRSGRGCPFLGRHRLIAVLEGPCAARTDGREQRPIQRGESVLAPVSGGVILGALPFGAGADVARDLHAALEGKVLLDCSNPLGPSFRLLAEGGSSAAQHLAAAAPGAHVAKAFNLCHDEVWRRRPPVFDGRHTGRGRSAETTRRRWRGYANLVRDVGCEPVAGGGLERAGLLEATAALFIALWAGEGAESQAIAPPLAHAAGPGHQEQRAAPGLCGRRGRRPGAMTSWMGQALLRRPAVQTGKCGGRRFGGVLNALRDWR